ncbi:hypothetical protein E0504_35070 [Parafrankia sp. BMG5.11]|nr:hypothetical protein E0504_35070 [Parafrankia sp. BMG5.11]
MRIATRADSDIDIAAYFGGPQPPNLRAVTDDLSVLRREADAGDERRADPIWLRGVKYTFVTAIECEASRTVRTLPVRTRDPLMPGGRGSGRRSAPAGRTGSAGPEHQGG